MNTPSVQCLSLSEDEQKSESGFVHHYSIQETYPLHTHTFYEFFLVSKGKGIHHINHSDVVLKEGSFVFVRPTDQHSYGFLNQYDLELINIPFSASLFDKVCHLLGCPASFFTESALSLQTEIKGQLLSDIKERMLFINEVEKGQKRRQYLLAVLPFFFYQFCITPSYESALLPVWLSSLIHKMKEPANFIIGLPRLLELANLSQEHLNRMFRRYLNMSPTEFINMLRMEYAAELLLLRRQEIIEICQECGFQNLSHFYRVFRKQYGCTPRQFLQKNS